MAITLSRQAQRNRSCLTTSGTVRRCRAAGALNRSVMMEARENALRTIKFNSPERVVGGPPTHGFGYRGCNHEGLEGGLFCGSDQGMPGPEANIQRFGMP